MCRFVHAAILAGASCAALPAFAQSMPSMGTVRAVAAEAKAVVDDIRYQAGDKVWSAIGRRQVAADTEADRIAIEGDKRFGKVRLCAVGRPIELRHLAVTFQNGTDQRIAIDRTIAADQCTATLDLAGKGRRIDAVDFTFAKPTAGSEPEVVIQAR